MSTNKSKTTKATIYIDDYEFVRSLSFKATSKENKRVTIPDILQRILKEYERNNDERADENS